MTRQTGRICSSNESPLAGFYPSPIYKRQNWAVGGRTRTRSVASKSTTLAAGGLDLDTAIRLRWALRDIKAKRTKLTLVKPSDLGILIEMGLVELRDDVPTLSNEGHRALDQ
jgi:hypothetical protein